MKNIFIVPTDQQSRLLMAKSNNNLFLDPHKDFVFNSANWEYQYLYITSDEEIREDDWYMTRDGKPTRELFNLKRKGRVVLTTDPSLIEDGVQDIDDTFLKWFIKNSTREFVHVEKGFSDGTDYGFNFIDYQIILPKKCDCTHFCRRGTFDDWIMYCDDDANEKQLDPLPEFELKKDIFDTLSSLLEPRQYPIGGFAPGSYWCNCVTCKEKFMGDKRAVQCEPCAIEMVNIKVKINEQGGIESVKEDTVETAAEEYFLQEYSWNGKDSLPYKEEDVKLTKENFIAGAKWQAKRMYSEADNIMKFLDTEVELKLSDKKTIERIKWYFETYFEQFKKK